jgi:GrpB-like predicted nucleotidyltransferase (UPF0157 family)
MTEIESLEQAIHEDIALCGYDPHWPSLFVVERDHLATLFPSQFLEIQHIGSTAIPDMPAKPIIDILAGVESMVVADALVEPLLASGYTTSAAFNATLTDRRWFMRWANGRRTHHLHVVVYGGGEWHRHLHFRDTLRSNAAMARKYSDLKITLAAEHKADREAYTNAKSSFVLLVTGDA